MTRPRARWLTALVLAAGMLPSPHAAASDCLGDCADPGDLTVNVLDFLAMLAQWGGPGSCDFNEDGTVDVIDFLFLLAIWGYSCEYSRYLDIELDGVFRECDRCVYIVSEGCAKTDVVLTFTDHDGDPATPVRFQGTVVFDGVKCDVVSPTCVKVEQHTLSDRVYLDPPYHWTLRAGDTDNDDDVDEVDLAFLRSQMGLPPQPGGCPWDGTRDADLNCDGIVDEADEAMLVANLGLSGECLEPPGSP
jgi:hypothetical protein